MLETTGQVVRALEHFDDLWSLREGSVVMPTRSASLPGEDPFHRGFIAQLEERRELGRRMQKRLSPRDRKLLVLWYVRGLTPLHVAQGLGVSRSYCYRLKQVAVEALCGETDGGDQGKPR